MDKVLAENIKLKADIAERDLIIEQQLCASCDKSAHDKVKMLRKELERCLDRALSPVSVDWKAVRSIQKVLNKCQP
jgi:hypothetical protein